MKNFPAQRGALSDASSRQYGANTTCLTFKAGAHRRPG
jgi:hypothetical protein